MAMVAPEGTSRLVLSYTVVILALRQRVNAAAAMYLYRAPQKMEIKATKDFKPVAIVRSKLRSLCSPLENMIFWTKLSNDFSKPTH